MTLEEVKALGNWSLLDIYADMVRADHYDPFETPKAIVNLRKNGITTTVLENLILERMSKE